MGICLFDSIEFGVISIELSLFIVRFFCLDLVGLVYSFFVVLFLGFRVRISVWQGVLPWSAQIVAELDLSFHLYRSVCAWSTFIQSLNYFPDLLLHGILAYVVLTWSVWLVSVSRAVFGMTVWVHFIYRIGIKFVSCMLVRSSLYRQVIIQPKPLHLPLPIPPSLTLPITYATNIQKLSKFQDTIPILLLSTKIFLCLVFIVILVINLFYLVFGWLLTLSSLIL